MHNCTCKRLLKSDACNYYYSSVNFNFILQGDSPLHLRCLNYTPVVKNGTCRICLKKASQHRKSYIYSHLARKIQLCWFRYLIRKKTKGKYVALLDKIRLYKYYFKGRKTQSLPKKIYVYK